MGLLSCHLVSAKKSSTPRYEDIFSSMRLDSVIGAEYDWKELWTALLGLLNFLASKIDSLATTGGVEHLVREVMLIESVKSRMILMSDRQAILLIDLALSKSESYLPSPRSLHEFIVSSLSISSTPVTPY